MPGTYSAKLTVNGRSYTQSFEVAPDPRVTVTPAGLAAQFHLQQRMVAGIAATYEAFNFIQRVRSDAAAQPIADGLAEVASGPTGLGTAHRDLAQLRWMRGGRIESALRMLDDALRRAPREKYLHLVRSIALEFMGELPAALASAEAGLVHAPAELELLQQASHLCAETGALVRAVELARLARKIAPDVPAVQITLCES